MSGLTRRLRRTLIGERRRHRGKVLWQQRFNHRADAPVLPPRQRPGATPDRIAHIRRELAAGIYLSSNAEQKLTAVVEGLLSDMTNSRRDGEMHRTPLSAIAV